MATLATSTALEQLKAHMAVVDDLGATIGLLSWDQETHCPPKGMEPRGRQMATLSALYHQKMTDPALHRWLEALQLQADTLSADDRALLRVVKRDVDHATKLPEWLVQRQSETSAKAHPIWVNARKTNQFEAFAPVLAELVDLAQQEADFLGYEGSRYDALLDLYEPGLTTAQLDPLFAQLQQALVPLIQAIADSPNQPDEQVLRTRLSDSVERQKTLNNQVLEAMGFDLQAGRVDEAPHPFCSGSHPGDVRLTNRYLPEEFVSSLFSALHEGGHGLYEQGTPEALAGTPLAGGVSLGIHESQSRLWENLVGRSAPFWEWLYPTVQQLFPDPLQTVDWSTFYRAVNRVKPSLIRVEADELTYNLHIVLRYRLEKALIEGTLAVQDIPEAWNEAMATLLGVRPDNDTQGCLQDIHWAHGSFGYFPTYTLGNLYASQFFFAAQQALPQLDSQLRQGQLLPLREWLRQAIHEQGKRLTPDELCRQVTGEALNPQYFIGAMQAKYKALYGISG